MPEPLEELVGPHQCEYDQFDGESAGTIDADGNAVVLYGWSCRLCEARTFKTDVPEGINNDLPQP